MRSHSNRRQFLTYSLAAATAMLARPVAGRASSGAHSLRFYHLHTGESLETVYWADGDYLSQGLDEIDRLLRDFRTGEVKPIDPSLLDQLHRLRRLVGSDEPFHVVSGYRSPKTNAKLRKNGNGVAKRSLHMRGMAVDIMLPGTRFQALHRAALSLNAGGVGSYPNPGFIHLDSGRVRSW